MISLDKLNLHDLSVCMFPYGYREIINYSFLTISIRRSLNLTINLPMPSSKVVFMFSPQLLHFYDHPSFFSRSSDSGMPQTAVLLVMKCRECLIDASLLFYYHSDMKHAKMFTKCKKQNIFQENRFKMLSKPEKQPKYH